MESLGNSHSKLSNSHGITAIITIFFTLVTLLPCCSAARIQSNPQTKTEFIKTSCGVTLYPTLCYESLSPYANSISTPGQLANVALNVSLKAAQLASEKVSKLSKERDFDPREARAVLDCVENMEDSVDELQRCVGEMKDLGGQGPEEKMGNVMTWVSAALTDEGTCMDGFQDSGMTGKIKGRIGKCIVNFAQLTSNALALIKNLSSAQLHSP